MFAEFGADDNSASLGVSHDSSAFENRHESSASSNGDGDSATSVTLKCMPVRALATVLFAVLAEDPSDDSHFTLMESFISYSEDTRSDSSNSYVPPAGHEKAASESTTESSSSSWASSSNSDLSDYCGFLNRPDAFYRMP